MDNILTLITAGQVTTARAITWIVKYLDEHADAQDKLRSYQEMQLNCNYKNSSPNLTHVTLYEMQYASKVVKETLTMATIISWFPREALKDCQIGDYGQSMSCLLLMFDQSSKLKCKGLSFV